MSEELDGVFQRLDKDCTRDALDSCSCSQFIVLRLVWKCDPSCSLERALEVSRSLELHSLQRPSKLLIERRSSEHSNLDAVMHLNPQNDG